FIHHAVPTVAISQIQSNGQFLLGNIPALFGCRGANLFHCRSPFYLCFEHVDNLGAYTASRPETGLLISSDFVNRQRVILWPAQGPPKLMSTFESILFAAIFFAFLAGVYGLIYKGSRP